MDAECMIEERLMVVIVSILGGVFCAIAVLRLVLYVRSRREAERKSIAEYLDQKDAALTAGPESQESRRPSQVPGPTAWKQ